MPVEITEQQIEQARAKECLDVDHVGLSPGESIVELFLVDDCTGRMETRVAFSRRQRIFEEGPDHTGEFFPKLTEAGIVGHYHHTLSNRQHTRRFGDHACHRRPTRMLSCHLILHHDLHHGVSQHGIEHRRRIFIGATKGVAAAIARLEAEHCGLQAAESSSGCESTGLAREIEHGKIDLGLPQGSVTSTHDESVHRPPDIPLARGDPYTPAFRLVSGAGFVREGGEGGWERG